MDRRIVQQSRGGLPALTLDKMNHFVDTLKGTGPFGAGFRVSDGGKLSTK
jgi:hypothetical protein